MIMKPVYFRVYSEVYGMIAENVVMMDDTGRRRAPWSRRLVAPRPVAAAELWVELRQCAEHPRRRYDLGNQILSFRFKHDPLVRGADSRDVGAS